VSVRLKVAVICGGPSSEAEVSRASGKAIAAALTEKGHTVARVELDHFTSESIRQGGYDVVFPIAHGAVGEDGGLQGLLEVLGVPYVGSGVLASAVAMDKPTAKLVFASRGLPLARGRAVRPGDGEPLALAQKARVDVGRALVVKPVASGSAIGVHRFTADAADEAVAAAILATFRLGDGALIEEMLVGREVTCGVLERNGTVSALPPTEILAEKDAFYTYEARYAPGRSRHVCPAQLGEANVALVQEIAVRAHQSLGCRDLSRADFVVSDERVTLLEVNTLPGFTGTSLYPEAAGIVGLSMPELCDTLAYAAYRRGPAQRNAPVPLPT
jgi:D-alanine-D-alanine ligase